MAAGLEYPELLQLVDSDLNNSDDSSDDHSDSTVREKVIPPKKKSQDLKSISTTNVIKHWYDMNEWKLDQKFTCRMGFIFDLSKFYIVTMHKEATAFQNYINSHYRKEYQRYLIPSSDVQSQMYCIVYTDDAYYRGYITNIPVVRSTQPRAVVHLFDFGHTLLCTFDCLMYMTEDLYTVPKFAIRALLNGVQPYESALWSYGAIQKFEKLTIGVVLTCFVTGIHAAQKTLYVKLYRPEKRLYSINIAEAILLEKLASPIVKIKTAKKAGLFVSKLRFPFLFPSHEAIENGAVPYNMVSFDILTKCIASENLLRPYFRNMNSKNIIVANFTNYIKK